jgi:transcriptional regulator with XRE-family HTH domain
MGLFRRKDAEKAYSRARTETMVALRVTSALTWYMESNGISREELARRLDVHIGRVHMMLDSNASMTLRTLAALCDALGADLEVTIKKSEHEDAY